MLPPRFSNPARCDKMVKKNRALNRRREGCIIMKSGMVLECAIIAFVAYGFLRAVIRIITVKRRGVEAVGWISRMEEHITTDGDGVPMTSYGFYVQFETREGRRVEAELSNPSQRLAVGDMVRVKYLPEKPDAVVLVEILR